jgi:Ca2+-binding RTX toxin-like protein
VGADGNDAINGGSGNDVLRGGGDDDFLSGLEGQDRLFGDTGKDILIGGLDADQFSFDEGDSGTTGATADRIRDFSQSEGDTINLWLIDANTGTAADDPFTFIGPAGFSGTAGELRTFQTNGHTIVQGDTDGDGGADFMIVVEGLPALNAGDFVL